MPVQYSPVQMKQCLYCGRANPMAAATCEGCGSTEFEIIPLPPSVQSAQPGQAVQTKQVLLGLRIVYFFFVGWIVSFYWLLLDLCVFVTVMAWPFSGAMFRILPTVATLYRNPHYTAGDALRSGWEATLSRYKAAPLIGKVLAPLAFVVCAALLVYWFYKK